MNKVQPIRDIEQLNKCFDIAREHDQQKRKGEVSWELILAVGFNTSLRISDIRRFRVKDLRGSDYAETRAQKTGKEARILINPPTRKIINRLLAKRDPNEFIIQSKQRNSISHKYEAITRQRAYQIINIIAKQAGIKDRVGCHTLRKTFGYHYYKLTGDVVSLQRILGHSSRRETLIYIGIIDEEIDESLMKFNLTGRR